MKDIREVFSEAIVKKIYYDCISIKKLFTCFGICFLSRIVVFCSIETHDHSQNTAQLFPSIQLCLMLP